MEFSSTIDDNIIYFKYGKWCLLLRPKNCLRHYILRALILSYQLESDSSFQQLHFATECTVLKIHV
jgi:hypothetical protein